MKQIPKQKWILSTLLVAALGSQYYFSTSSKNLGALDLASTAPEVQALVDVTAALQQTVVIAASADASRAATSSDATRAASADASRAASADASRAAVQAVAPTPCSDCVVLSRAQAERLRAILEVATGKKDPKKDELTAQETPAEKRRREREEREERRRDEAEAKAEKLREEKLARQEEFTEKVEEMTYKCDGDVSCLSSRFSSLLLRYSGKKKIDISVVQAAFRKHIDPVFKAALADPDKREATVEALNSITRDIPLEYRAVKESALASVKSVISERAIAANRNFKLAEQLSKANKVTESISVSQQAEQEAAEFTAMGQFYTSTINSSLKEIGDSVTQMYMRNTFTPDLNKLFMNMRLTSSTTTINPDGTVTTGNNSTQGSRNARSGNPTTVTNQPQVSNPSTTGNGNVQFGSPQQGSRSGGRGSY